MSARPDDDVALSSVNVVSGVSAFDHAPFCMIEAQLTDGRLFVGQLEAAESAEHDAIVFAMMRDRLGVDDATAASFIYELRQLRAGQ